MKIARNLNHRKRRTQISALVLLACSSVYSSASMAANVVRGPYVQMGTDSSMIVRWNTDTATSSQVKFGSAVNSLSQTITDSAATTQHEVTLTGLSSLTRYYYSIGSEGTVLAGNDADTFFRTSPVPGQASPTRIWVIGDPGTAGDRQPE